MAAKKAPAKKVEVEPVEKAETGKETIIDKIEDAVEKVEETFESWWNRVAVGLIHQGHSDKTILVSAAQQSEADYNTFVKKDFAGAIEKHGRDLKKVAEVAFNTKK